jgi:uncharacterized protein
MAGLFDVACGAKGVMSPMELDGYLTGVVVSPDLLPPNRWLDGIWGGSEPIFGGLDQMQAVIAALMVHYNAITAALDAGFKQIEDKKRADYRPLFLDASDKAKPCHGADLGSRLRQGYGACTRTLERHCRR